MNKSDLTNYVREEYLEFGNNRTKNIAPSNSFLLTWSESYILAGLLEFYQPRNKHT